MLNSQDVLDFIFEFKWGDVPPQVKKQVALNALDLIGVGLGGSQTKLSKIICQHAAEDFAGPIPMLFHAGTASAAGVALAGGMSIDALDAHDGYNPAKGHAGCGLLPALYAIHKQQGCNSGAAFLEDLTLGYELACRAAVAQHETVPDYHTSGAWVAVAIAGVAAKRMGLGRDAIHHAMGIAEYHGPRSQMMRCIDTPTMLKDGSGWGAMAGVSAARLARLGFTGAPALLLDTDHWQDLGQNWLTCQQYYKPYPVCRWAQAPIRAVLALKNQHNLSSQDVEKIEIISFHEAVRLGQKNVTNTEEAQYSTSFPCAVALVHGDVQPHHISGDALTEPETKRLSAALFMSEDENANRQFPAKRPARARLTLVDGRQLESEWTEPDWDASDPPSAADLIAKFHTYAGPVVGLGKAKQIEQAVLGLCDGPTESLFRALNKIAD